MKNNEWNIAELEAGAEAYENGNIELLIGSTPSFLAGYKEAFEENNPHDNSGHLIEELWDSHLFEFDIAIIGGKVYRDADLEKCGSCFALFPSAGESVMRTHCPRCNAELVAITEEEMEAAYV